MARKSLTDETKAYGTFLTNFLNCKLNPVNMSALFEECLSIMKHYLGYDNPKWNEVQITSGSTFNELVSMTEHGYFKGFIAPWFRLHALGGYHYRRKKIFNEKRNKLIDEAQIKTLDAKELSWGEKNESTRQDFNFFIKFALLRKNFRKVINRIIKGDTLENIQYDDIIGDFLLRLKSEYFDLNQQIIIRGNQVKLAPHMTDIPNKTYSAILFLDGFLQSCLFFCLVGFSENEKNFRRLKKCKVCGIFFFTERADERIKYCPNCSSKSKMSREQRKEYQRNWRERRRQIESESQYQKRVENIMERTGFPREEVEEMLRADLTLM